MSHDARESSPPEFRHQAEQHLSKIITKTVPILDPQHTKALIDELQVHQIELLLQNHELERTRLEAEERLERYRDLFESAPVAYGTLDQRGRIQQMNHAAEVLLAVDRQTVIGHPFAMFVPEEEMPRFTLACRVLLTAPGHHKFNCALTVGGVRRTVRIDGCATTTEDGSPQLRFALIDLTARTHTGELQRESEARYRTLFELAPVAVYSCDALGVIQEYNDRAAELWGRRPQLGDTDERFCGSFKLYRPDGSFMPHEQCPMGDVLSGKIPGMHDGEVHIERPDGSRVIVIVNIAPLTDHQGEIIGAINCFYDVTDRKRDEEQLRHVNDQLEARVAARTEELTRSQEGLRALASELNLAEHRERTRLATELHDHLAQMLVYGRMKLAEVKHMPDLMPRRTAIINETDDVLTRSLDYTHTLIADLSPPILREFGLLAALHWLAV